jgi:polysaccharide biosynthesis protein PslG
MRTKNKLILIVAGVIALSGMLALDIAYRGLFWQFAWSVTGEEEPVGQLRAVPQWITTQLRSQPDTDPLVPINYAGENPYGINTFLQLEVEAPKIETMLQMISDAGFTWLRQEFPWEDIEVDGRGQFTDSRWDYDGDGIPDAIDSWAKYDQIIDLTEEYGLRLQVRLDKAPAWAFEEEAEGSYPPPDDMQDFVNFAVAVAERYKGRIQHYQIWNEPNIYPEWGNQAVNPEAYTDMLCRTYTALKAVDPDIVVISAALGPTIALTERDLNDLIYLQRMYDAGVADCFDVLSAQGYGLFSGPTDQRMRPTTVNVGHHIYVRDIMVANGDAHKPIWISEAAWNSVPTPEEEPNITGIREQYGQVTQEQAADYIAEYYQRAQEEWPWIGVINYWFFTRPDPFESDQPMYYFRMVEPDYQPDTHPTFTPLPVYTAMQEQIAYHFPTLYQGAHQADNHWAIDSGEAQIVMVDDAQFGRAVETTYMAFTSDATDVIVRWKGEGFTIKFCDASTSTYTSEHDGWNITTIHHSQRAQIKSINILADTPILIDSITILDRTNKNLFPYYVGIFISLFMLILAIWDGLRERHK